MSAKVKDLRSPCSKRWASCISGRLDFLMTFQAVRQLCFGCNLYLAQQFMRDIANFKTATQLQFEMNEQTCSYLSIG
jgi:hypothetical protein